MKQKSYVPSAYPNPCGLYVARQWLGIECLISSICSALAYFYAKLQSLAFEEEFFDPLQTEDQTKPLTIGIHKVSRVYCSARISLLTTIPRS
jgi:hypothetical protein